MVLDDAPQELAIVGRGAISEVMNFATSQVTRDKGGLERRVLEHIPFQCAADGANTCTVVDYTAPPTNTWTSPSSYFAIGTSSGSGDSGAGVFDQETFESQLHDITLALEAKLGVQLAPAIGEGMRVRIKAGPLEGVEGWVEERYGMSTVLLRLDFISQAAAVKVEAHQLEPI